MVSTELQEAALDAPLRNSSVPLDPPGRRSIPWTLFTWALVLSSLFVGATASVVFGGLAWLFGDRYRKVAHATVAAAFRFIVRTHPRYELEIVGRESLPAGAAVWCPNHASLSDVVYLFALPGQFKWVIKKELFYVPMFGAAMRMAGYPKIDRGDVDSATRLIGRVSHYLKANIPVLSFPEGTRSYDGKLQRFFAGPARMAIQNQVPLVPMAIVGTQRLLPRDRWSYPSKGKIVIVIGEPISTTGCAMREARALTRELKRRVAEAHAQARARVPRDELAGWL